MKKLICFLLLCLVLLQTNIRESNADDTQELSLLAINVGKADCLLLRSGETAYLIDTGTKKKADQVLEVLNACGVDHLNGIILTHTHADHAGGLKKIIESNLPVDAIYAPSFYVLKKEDGKHPIKKLSRKQR